MKHKIVVLLFIVLHFVILIQYTNSLSTGRRRYTNQPQYQQQQGQPPHPNNKNAPKQQPNPNPKSKGIDNQNNVLLNPYDPNLNALAPKKKYTAIKNGAEAENEKGEQTVDIIQAMENKQDAKVIEGKVKKNIKNMKMKNERNTENWNNNMSPEEIVNLQNYGNNPPPPLCLIRPSLKDSTKAVRRFLLNKCLFKWLLRVIHIPKKLYKPCIRKMENVGSQNLFEHGMFAIIHLAKNSKDRTNKVYYENVKNVIAVCSKQFFGRVFQNAKFYMKNLKKAINVYYRPMLHMKRR